MYLGGEKLNHLQVLCLESLVRKEDIIRVVDAFVENQAFRTVRRIIAMKIRSSVIKNKWITK